MKMKRNIKLKTKNELKIEDISKTEKLFTFNIL